MIKCYLLFVYLSIRYYRFRLVKVNLLKILPMYRAYCFTVTRYCKHSVIENLENKIPVSRTVHSRSVDL